MVIPNYCNRNAAEKNAHHMAKSIILTISEKKNKENQQLNYGFNQLLPATSPVLSSEMSTYI